jgi:hypothetical protein
MRLFKHPLMITDPTRQRMDVVLVFTADVKNCPKTSRFLYGERNGD